MATKRQANSGRQAPGPEKDSPFINTPWGREQDDAFESWLQAAVGVDTATCIHVLVSEGCTIKIGGYGQSYFATVDDPEASKLGGKHLLSGWSDSPGEAVQIAFWKWDCLLSRDFSHPTDAPAKSRRR